MPRSGVRRGTPSDCAFGKSSFPSLFFEPSNRAPFRQLRFRIVRRHLWRLPPASNLHIDHRSPRLGERDSAAYPERITRDEILHTRSFCTGFDDTLSRDNSEPFTGNVIAPAYPFSIMPIIKGLAHRTAATSRGLSDLIGEPRTTVGD